MKRIIFLFSALLAINSFACEGVVHETLQEVKALHHEGFKSEARGLMHELAHSDVFNCSQAQIECYNNTAGILGSGFTSNLVWACMKCGWPHFGAPPSRCKRPCGCSGTKFELIRRAR